MTASSLVLYVSESYFKFLKYTMKYTAHHVFGVPVWESPCWWKKHYFIDVFFFVERNIKIGTNSVFMCSQYSQNNFECPSESLEN